MLRREFMTGLGTTALGSALLLAPFAASAQAAKKIGISITANADSFLPPFQEGMRDFGYREGGNVNSEIRSADGNIGRFAALAAELAALKVDVIVAHQTPAVVAAKQVTSTIPIVTASAGDPVGQGLIASLARPGGNITGMSATTAELGAKSLELVREIIPSVRRVALLANAADPFATSFLEQLQPTGREMRLDLPVTMIKTTNEVGPALETIAKSGVDAIIVQPSLPRRAIAELALRHRLPVVSPATVFGAEGGLASYAASASDNYRESARYVDRILKGSKPADLPVEQPSTFVLSVNLKTAKALGLTIPSTLLARADEVIE